MTMVESFDGALDSYCALHHLRQKPDVSGCYCVKVHCKKKKKIELFFGVNILQQARHRFWFLSNVTLIAGVQCRHFKFMQTTDMYNVSISKPKQLPTRL